jgi:hypothetical protein
MTLSALGIFSAAGAAVASAGAYELISSTILGSDTASITFSSLGDYASTYKHLQLRVVARTDSAVNERDLLIRFNGVTSASYTTHRLLGNGSTVSSNVDLSETSIRLRGGVVGASQTANIFASSVTDILDYSSASKNKTVRSLSGYAGSAARNATLFSGFLVSTDAITSINVRTLDGNNLITGSRCSLYGLKG